ncbi:MAG: hypothetical protein QOE73_417, partial [Verrucomicrobiota bacterium]
MDEETKASAAVEAGVSPADSQSAAGEGASDAADLAKEEKS